jgi:hypothetical protein
LQWDMASQNWRGNGTTGYRNMDAKILTRINVQLLRLWSCCKA